MWFGYILASFHKDHCHFQCFSDLLVSFRTSGKELSATIENLRPATDYHVRCVFRLDVSWYSVMTFRISNNMYICICRVQAICNCLQGNPSEPASFTTLSCEPDTPIAPRKASGTKNCLVLQWKVHTHMQACTQLFLQHTRSQFFATDLLKRISMF